MNLELSNPAKEALDAEGSVLVIGGPGSGKTTLALLKAQRLIPSLLPGQQVLFLSFSRAAVRQVLVRCRDVLASDERKLISVKTYHAFCMDLLKSHARLLTGNPARIAFPSAALLAKSAHDGDWKVEQQRLAKEESTYCFEQFAPSSVEILTRAAPVLDLISRRFPIVILDEFQDTDNAQWELVKLLSRQSRLIALADLDQRIFDYDPTVDPERLNHLREFLHPAAFDLGDVNHRSPDASILGFANAVLWNAPLPTTGDVTLAPYWVNGMQATVHARIVWAYSNLRKRGISEPTLAVLCRTNSLVADVSAWLHDQHTLNGTTIGPTDHDVVWDAELTTAAAQVVASIMEWPQHDLKTGVTATLNRIAHFYDLKNADHPSDLARRNAISYRAAVTAVLDNRDPRLEAAKQLVSSFTGGFQLVGKPGEDWLAARNIVASIPKLKEIFTSARFVRLFQATEEIGGVLGKEWLTSGTYGKAAETIRRTLETRQLVSANAEPRGIVLMTMHKAKGKEFDGVVMVEGQRKGMFFDPSREAEPFESSRRLLRVAITRARYKVCIVRPQGARALTDH